MSHFSLHFPFHFLQEDKRKKGKKNPYFIQNTCYILVEKRDLFCRKYQINGKQKNLIIIQLYLLHSIQYLHNCCQEELRCQSYNFFYHQGAKCFVATKINENMIETKKTLKNNNHVFKHFSCLTIVIELIARKQISLYIFLGQITAPSLRK